LLEQEPRLDEESLELFRSIRDEEAAIVWLDDFISDRSKTFGEVAPAFRSSLASNTELDLERILIENFRYDDETDRYSKPNNDLEREELQKKSEENRLKRFERWRKEFVQEPSTAILRKEDIMLGIWDLSKKRKYREVIELYNALPPPLRRDREMKKIFLRAEAMVRG